MNPRQEAAVTNQVTKPTSTKQVISNKYSSLRTYLLSDLVLVWYLVTCALVTFALLVPFAASADAVMYISPERGTYKVGQTFEVKVYADSGGSLINAAEGDIAFQKEALEVLSVSKQGSILQSWSTEPDFSHEDGTIKFAGWTRDAYKGPNGLLVTITFKALRSMVGNAHLAAGAILAADAQESNIISSMRSGVFTITPEEIAEAPAADGEAMASSTEIKAKVPAPVFSDFPDTVTKGDRIVVRGSAEPNAHVYFWLSRGSEQEVRSEVLSASDGSFTYVSEEKVGPGIYHLRASVETKDGRTSSQSETIDMTVADTGVAASAAVGVSLVFELLPFFALLVVTGLAGAYIFHRHQLAKMHYGSHSMYDQD